MDGANWKIFKNLYGRLLIFGPNEDSIKLMGTFRTRQAIRTGAPLFPSRIHSHRYRPTSKFGVLPEESNAVGLLPSAQCESSPAEHGDRERSRRICKQFPKCR